jgi:hypothetical protein
MRAPRTLTTIRRRTAATCGPMEGSFLFKLGLKRWRLQDGCQETRQEAGVGKHDGVSADNVGDTNDSQDVGDTKDMAVTTKPLKSRTDYPTIF